MRKKGRHPRMDYMKRGFLTPPEFAIIMNVCSPQVYAWIARKQIEGVITLQQGKTKRYMIPKRAILKGKPPRYCLVKNRKRSLW